MSQITKRALEQSLKNLLQQKPLSKITISDITEKTYDTWQQGFVQIFHAVRENKVFVMNVYRCVNREQVEKYLVPLTDQLIMGVITERAAGMTVREADQQFIAQVYSYAFVGIMLDWIRDDMRADPRSW